jgi:hypothetical protein
MRESVAFLRTNADKWGERKIECERRREEEKKDRLAVVKEKKRKYGIKRLSKDENIRMNMRTEERLEIARAKENLWTNYREHGEMRKEEEEAWEMIREKILVLEEGGTWREQRKETSRIGIRLGWDCGVSQKVSQ